MSNQPTICVFCGGDCSAIAHMRDSQGRYACAACVQEQRERRAASQRQAPAAAGTGRETAPQRAPSRPANSAATAATGHNVAEKAGYALNPVPVAPLAAPAGSNAVCPVCIIRMPPDLGRCAQCGYDPKLGIQSSRKFKKKQTKEGTYRPICSQCGYDMTGVPGTRCPECGTVSDLSRRARDRAESRRIAIWSYLKPAIMLGVGLMGILLILLLTGELSMAGFYLVKLAVFVPIGVFAFFMCCLLWIGFDAPFHRVALELAGIYAVIDLISLAIYSVVDVYLVNSLVLFFVYIGMLASILDLDYGDAVAVAFVNLILRIALMVVLFQVFG